jgi:heme-degrading monooxygenase HmoA
MEPTPPYVAVIFTSVQGADTEGYAATAERMEHLAAGQPGCLGIESARDAGSGLGITVSYWRTEQDAQAWKAVAEHVQAQRTGRDRWYDRYQVRVATVTRAYGFDRDLRSEPQGVADPAAPPPHTRPDRPGAPPRP